MTRKQTPRDAQETLSKALATTAPEPTGPVEALGCVLSDAVTLPRASPLHPTSAMDGFAVEAHSTPGRFPILGEAGPGDGTRGELKEGACTRILTGAPLPTGADAVVPMERAHRTEGGIELPQTRAGANVVPAGAAHAAGTRVEAGTRITPGLALTLVDQGIEAVEVHRPLPVRLVPVGTELVEGSVTDTVVPTLAALLARWGCPVRRCDPVSDDPALVADALAGDETLVVTTGGTGPSATDPIRDVGFETVLFDGLHAKPGKPTRAAVLEDGRLWVALPGNPTAALFVFRAVLLPAILASMGHASPPPGTEPRCAVAEPVPGHAKRWRIAPVKRGPNGVVPAPEGPSLAPGWWATTDGLVLVPPGHGLAEGQAVGVMLW